MQHRFSKVVTLGLCLLAAAPGLVSAQFIVPQFVFGSGAQASQGNDYFVVGIVGQPVLGTVSNVNMIHVAGFWAQIENVVTEVEPVSDVIPRHFELNQNYPNPFNPTTTIQFAIPQKSHVSLKLFDLLGREVAILVEDEMVAGIFKVTFEAHELPSGTYFYRLRADGFSQSRRLTLVK